MRGTSLLLGGAPRRDRADLAGHQLTSPADLSTKVSYLAIYRGT